MSSHQRLPDPSERDLSVSDIFPGDTPQSPKTDHIAEEIGKLIPLVNDSLQSISRPSGDANTGNLASHLTWDDDGELSID
jgi:hypothetical protein